MTLKTLLDRTSKQLDDFYNTGKLIQWFLDEVERKRKLYPFWQKKIRFSYSAFLKKIQKNGKINDQDFHRDRSNILKYFYHDDKFEDYKQISEENLSKVIPEEKIFMSGKYFEKKIMEIFSYFFTKLLPFKESNLKQISQPIRIYADIQSEYIYYFSKEELDALKEFREQNEIDESVERTFEILFSAAVTAMSIQIQKIIKEDNFNIELMCGHCEFNNKKPKLKFIISVKQKEAILNDFYLKTEIFHFSEVFSEQLPQNFKDRLRMEKNLIYLLALDRYFSIEPYIITILIRLYTKCKILGHITPILDVLNFVASRVEDSKFKTKDLLNSICDTYSCSEAKKNGLKHLFEICNKNAGLFATFQSNNRPQMYEQYHLSLLYMQYFLLNPESLYLKDIFNEKRNELYNQKPHYQKYNELFNSFLLNTFLISQNPAVDIFLKNTFNNSLMDLNENFFKVFLNSINQSFFLELEKVNEGIEDSKITYEFFCEFLMKSLFFMIKKIFIRKNPEIASNNFYDKLGRYSPKRLALRTLELLIFKEMPLSDNNWQNYDLSRNAKKVKKIFKNYLTIPDDYFFSQKRLVHINMMYVYELDANEYLEEWLVSQILTPFYEFCDNIIINAQKLLSEEDLENEKKIRIVLNKTINKIISKSIIKEEMLDNLEVISEWITEIFYDSIKSFIFEVQVNP